MIVETEAYHESEPACHAFVGLTPRTRDAVRPARPRLRLPLLRRAHDAERGLRARGVGAAVLIRALEPLEGIDLMRARRGRERARGAVLGPGQADAGARRSSWPTTAATCARGPVTIAPPAAAGAAGRASRRIGITQRGRARRGVSRRPGAASCRAAAAAARPPRRVAGAARRAGPPPPPGAVRRRRRCRRCVGVVVAGVVVAGVVVGRRGRAVGAGAAVVGRAGAGRGRAGRRRRRAGRPVVAPLAGAAEVLSVRLEPCSRSMVLVVEAARLEEAR